jgi:hypothetical protein
MRAMTIGVLLALWPAMGQAEDWRALDGSAIKAALEGRSLNYGDASQNFEVGGLTVYFADEPSTGAWRIEGNQFCSQWPPSDRWTCYDVEAKDGAVRFIGAGGDVTQGTYME